MTTTRRRRLTITVTVAVAIAATLVLALASWVGRPVTSATARDESAAGASPPDSSSARPAETAAPLTSGVYGAPTTGPIPTSTPEDVATDEAVEGGAHVVIAYAGLSAERAGIEVSALVPGVVEDGGTCTATASAAGSTSSVTVSATADASTTVCDDLLVPWTTGNGSASLVVQYDSPTTSALSDQTTVEIAR